MHWSHGSFGYFPTYSLGSFYAARFFATAQLQLQNLENGVSRKRKTADLLQWLRDNIHSQGRFSEELCGRTVPGKPFDVTYFIDYLLRKYTAIYTL